jgi:hypothetical protein
MPAQRLTRRAHCGTPARVKYVWMLTLAACGGAARPAPVEHHTAAPACIADELGTLNPEWKLRDDCPSDGAACQAECQAGDRNACLNRAISLDLDQREDEAMALYEATCRGGNALACTNVGAIGWLHKKRTPDCMLKLFQRACSADELMSCGMLGRMLVSEPATRDVARGRALLEQMCADRKGPPCHFLAYFLEQGTFGEVAPPERIRDLLERACDGDPSACGHASTRETFR